MTKRTRSRSGVERDTATMSLKHVVLGGGVFDNTGQHPNKKGWDIFELGQKSFWAVPTAVDWSVPVREDPEYAEAIAAMIAFLAPGEKAAVHGASMISTKVQSEEAKFYFVEQALEEAKHFDALRRLYGKITGTPLGEPSRSIRMLYSFGVVDPDDVAFMMGSINIIGEHLANQIFHQINHVAKDETVRKILALIGKDESRHIAAGQRSTSISERSSRRCTCTTRRSRAISPRSPSRASSTRSSASFARARPTRSRSSTS
jgi:rubrerythrin